MPESKYGAPEGMNNRIKLVNHSSFGFRNRDNYISAISLLCQSAIAVITLLLNPHHDLAERREPCECPPQPIVMRPAASC